MRIRIDCKFRYFSKPPTACRSLLLYILINSHKKSICIERLLLFSSWIESKIGLLKLKGESKTELSTLLSPLYNFNFTLVSTTTSFRPIPVLFSFPQYSIHSSIILLCSQVGLWEDWKYKTVLSIYCQTNVLGSWSGWHTQFKFLQYLHEIHL